LKSSSSSSRFLSASACHKFSAICSGAVSFRSPELAAEVAGLTMKRELATLFLFAA
jgi:hypothetical protein